MSCFDIELIDVNENVDNFAFTEVPKDCLDKIISKFRDKEELIEFSCSQGNIILERKYFRGLMYVPHIPKHKTVAQETFESAEEVGRIEIVKKVKKPKVIVKES